MCKVAADNGHKIEYLKGVNRPIGETYDINFDGIPTDLKSTKSSGNLVKYVKKAYKDQGAKAVFLELKIKNEVFIEMMAEAKRKYDVRIFYYWTDERKVREFK